MSKPQRAPVKNKKISVSMVLCGGGTVALFTGWGAAKIASFMSGMNDMAKMAGYGGTVTGATLIGASLALKLAAHFSKWFGQKYRAFLSSYNLKP